MRETPRMGDDLAEPRPAWPQKPRPKSGRGARSKVASTGGFWEGPWVRREGNPEGRPARPAFEPGHDGRYLLGGVTVEGVRGGEGGERAKLRQRGAQAVQRAVRGRVG